MTDEYTPFGKEWEAMLMRRTKKELIALYRASCKEKKQIYHLRKNEKHWVIRVPGWGVLWGIGTEAEAAKGKTEKRLATQKEIETKEFKYLSDL